MESPISIDNISIPTINDNFIHQLEVEWLERLKHFMDTVVCNIISTLQVAGQTDSFLLVTTGSDGRWENIKNASNLELLLYHLSEENTKVIDTLIIDELTKYNKDSTDVTTPGRWWLALELKSKQKPHYVEFHGWIFSPSRFIDSYKMFGSDESRKELADIYTSNYISTKKRTWRLDC